jgi:general secretion pathway protein D
VVEAPNGAYQLNFENADVASVCKVIFGDLLKTNYIVDPRVAGQISLTSSVPIPRARLVPLLESALLAVSASVVKENGLYRIAPTMDPGGLRRADYQTPGEGYGVTVIGSKYISAASIAHLLEEYGSRAGSVKMDPAANFVIVQGTGAERQAALETASMVDVDWLRLKSVAILPLSNSQPEQVITEINHILGTGEGGFSQDMVQMQPIARLNAVLAIARTRQLLDKVVLWAKRLDKQDYSSLSIKTYHLQYAQAKTVAGVLNDMFGGEGSRSASGQSDKDQLQPTSSPGTSSNSGSSPYSLSSQIGAATGSTASSGTGQSAGNTSSGGASSNPFGALKNTFATADDNKTNSSGSGAPSSTSNANRVHVTADVASNTLFIYANRQVYDSIERAIRDLDRAPTQVNIEVTIAEVTLTDDLQYGVQAYLNSGKVAGALTNTTTSLPLTTVNPAVNLLVGSVANPRVAISALSSVTNVKVLSSPSLVVSDRQVATLQIGDQVPILTQQATSTITAGAPVVNSVSYQDTGIILNVLPRVNANSVVSLEIEQQISAVSSTDPTTLTPTISQRRVHSSVSVPSGQTVLLAGLIQDKRSGTRDGIPGIASIKFLNDILTTHDTNVQRDELIIFIRPQIIRNSYDAQQVTEEFRSRLQSMQPQLIESHHRE